MPLVVTYEGVSWNATRESKKTEREFIYAHLDNQYRAFSTPDQIKLLKEAYRLIVRSAGLSGTPS